MTCSEIPASGKWARWRCVLDITAQSVALNLTISYWFVELPIEYHRIRIVPTCIIFLTINHSLLQNMPEGGSQWLANPCR